MALRHLPLLALFVMACTGSSDDSAPATDPAVPADDAPATRPPAAQTPPAPVPITPSFPTVTTRGGPIVKTPRVVPLVFVGDPWKDQIDAFTKKLAGSEYWSSVASEYGVGALTAGDVIELAETPERSLDTGAIDEWLAGKLSGETPELGAPDPNTLFVIFYPPTTTITMASGNSCKLFDGYHTDIAPGGTHIGYAVMPRCGGLDELTSSTSHEIFEWATDPFPKWQPAYDRLDDDHFVWQSMMSGELSDLCSYLDYYDVLRPAEIGFAVQRHWSNKASLAGKFPCVPSSGRPYVQSIPRVEDEAFVDDPRGKVGAGSAMIKTKAIRVSPGKKRVVDVLVYSDQPSKQLLDVRATSLGALYGEADSGFTFTLDKQQARAGAMIHLTIQAPKVKTFDTLVMSTGVDSNHVEYWPVLVTSDDP